MRCAFITLQLEWRLGLWLMGLRSALKVSEHGCWQDVIKVESIEGFEKVFEHSVTEGNQQAIFLGRTGCVILAELKALFDFF